MNIKLAEKVFPDERVFYKTGELFVGDYGEAWMVDFKNNPDHKLKLIEFIAKQLNKNDRDKPFESEWPDKWDELVEAIATNDNEKLVEIAESLLDE